MYVSVCEPKGVLLEAISWVDGGWPMVMHCIGLHTQNAVRGLNQTSILIILIHSQVAAGHFWPFSFHIWRFQLPTPDTDQHKTRH